jgi:hypothetical protein
MGPVHIPKDAMRVEGRPRYVAVDPGFTLTTPDELAQALERAEGASVVRKAQSRARRVLMILKRRLSDRALSIHLAIVGVGRSYRETASLLGINLATAQRYYAEATGVVNRLKAKGLLKAVPPLNILQVPGQRRSPLRDLAGKAMRSARLSRRLGLLREHGNGLPPGVLLRATMSAERAERAWLESDRQVADLLLNPPRLPSSPVVIPRTHG